MSEEPYVVVFSSLNHTVVHLVRTALAQRDIPSRMGREWLAPLAGEVPVDAARIELAVPEEYALLATSLVEAMRTMEVTEVACPTCGETCPSTFELCWSCGADL